jgi:hypothetical protein
MNYRKSAETNVDIQATFSGCSKDRRAQDAYVDKSHFHGPLRMCDPPANICL